MLFVTERITSILLLDLKPVFDVFVLLWLQPEFTANFAFFAANLTAIFSPVFVCEKSTALVMMYVVRLWLIRCVMMYVVQVCHAVWTTAHGCAELGIMERRDWQISSSAACVILAVHRSVRGTHSGWARTSKWPVVEFLWIFYAPGSLNHSLMCTHLLSQSAR